jgi:hypothetical protein
MWAERAFTRVSVVIEKLFRPWRRASTWWGLAYALLGFLVATVTFSIVFTLLVTTVSLLIVFPLAIPVAWLMFVVSAGLGVSSVRGHERCSAWSSPIRTRRSRTGRGGSG